MVSLLLRGNAYGLITARTGAAMRPAQVELVHPDLMTVTVLPDGRVEYRYRGDVVDLDDLWHVRAFTFPGLPAGLSPVEYARQTIGLGLATARFGVQFFEEGAAPAGLLTTDQHLNREQATQLKQSFTDVTRGKREPVVLGEGTTFQTISVSPTDAAWVESQRFTVSDVARVFGVPPEMVGGEAGNSLTYGNVEGRALDYLRYSVNPWLVRLETALGDLLPRGQYVKFNADGLLRSTTQERYAAYAVALDKGFLTVDEVRALEDRPPLTGGAGA
jgi:HK97 family phage portal protein